MRKDFKITILQKGTDYNLPKKIIFQKSNIYLFKTHNKENKLSYYRRVVFFQRLWNNFSDIKFTEEELKSLNDLNQGYQTKQQQFDN